MGNNITYEDGDIPRETMDIMTGPTVGYSYYKSSEQGQCNKCRTTTNNWYVTIKTKGHFLCESCRLNR